MTTRDDFQRQMDLKLKEFGAEIEKLRAHAQGDKVGVAKAEAKSQVYQQIEKLEASHRSLRHKIEALQRIAQDDQAKARADVEKAVATFKRDLDEVIARHR